MKRLLPIAAVVLLLLGGIILLQRRQEGEERRERAEARLLQFDDRRVSAVDLRVRGQHWRLERLGEGWRITEPVEDAADAAAVSTLLGAPRFVIVVRVIETPEALAAYGLEPPVMSLRLEGVRVPELQIGDPTPTDEGFFAKVDGRPGVLVISGGGAGAGLGMMDPTRLRDRSLVGMSASDVSELGMSTTSTDIALRQESDGWWITRPRRLPADDHQVIRLLERLQGVEVQGFHDGADPDSGEYGLGPGALHIRFRSSSGVRELTLGPVQDGQKRFAARDDRQTVLEVRAADLGELSMPVGIPDVMGRQLSRVNRYAVRRFAYRLGEARSAAARSQETWMTPDGNRVDDEQVYSFLAHVLQTTVSGWREVGSAAIEVIGELEYVLDDGSTGRIDFLPGDEARASWLPDVAFRLESPPPRVPTF